MRRIILIALSLVLVNAFAATAHASTYKFCGRWSYTFGDQGQGEDYLLHNAGSRGFIKAARTWSVIERNGVSIWSGYLDSGGCTPALTAVAGNYTFWLRPNLAKDSTIIDIYPDDQRNVRWFAASHPGLPVPGTGTTLTNTVGNGDPVASVAAVAAHLLGRTDTGLVADTYTIYAEQGCGDVGACSTAAAVYIGKDNFGNTLAFNKTVIAHELGHSVQRKLMGLPQGNYDLQTSFGIAQCHCNHVVTANRSHCIQSVEFIGAAETEGFAQFYAAKLFNNPSHNDAWFAYYKEFLVFGITFSPPVKMNALTPYKWNVSHCTSDDENLGVELDWMTFLYELHNKGTSAQKFSMNNIRDVYKKACGDATCNSQDLAKWSHLSLAVIGLYSLNGAKTAYWATMGNKHVTQ